ncbi:MAG TPA: LysE family translocator [Gaiellaceae bacterium]|nr:LysE family translocator [Gaiellaceae bacterium]
MHVDVLPFLALSVLLIVTPGPDTAMVTKNAVVGGRRFGVFAAVGVSVGLTIWTAAAALGIAALLRASSVAFFTLKVVGAVYLTWIGIQMLRSRGLAGGDDPSSRAASGLRALRQGVLSDLGNPKIAVFFTSLLPQFVHGHGSAFLPLLLMGVTFAVLTLVWLAAYALAVGHASGVLRRPAVRKALDRFTGLVLIGFGVRLAFERR